MTKLTALLLALFQTITISSVAALGVEQQQILQDATHPHQQHILGIREELIKAEIIPTVIDDFYPTLSINVTWTPSSSERSSKKKHKSKGPVSAILGNTLKPKALQSTPSITLTDLTQHDFFASAPGMKYTIAMTDPDAPSRSDPKWSEMCHWIATNVSLSGVNQDFDEVVEYKPPGPPPKTGKHRYVILAFAPANMTSLPLHLSEPGDRQHWGYGKEGMGVRKWAQVNGLVPVGANFIYAKNKKQ